MQNLIDETVGVISLRDKYIRELADKIRCLENLLQQFVGNTDCCCELFGRCRRILDIAGLLGVNELVACNDAYTHAEKNYRETKDLSFLQNWLDTIKSLKPTLDAAIHPKWNLKCITEVNAPTLPYVIHLALSEKYTSYLKKYFEKKVDKVDVTFDSNELLGSLDNSHHNIIVFDESWLRDHGVEVFDWIRQIENDVHYSVIYFTNSIDFNKRLQAVRNNISLICHEGYDEKLIIQSIEKDFIEHERRAYKLLLVSNDVVLSGVLELLFVQAGLIVDLCETPSDALLESLHKNKYDLILVDYFLDNMTGMELVNLLRQDKSMAYIPVIYLYSRTNVGCDIHDEAISNDSIVIDVYEPCNIVETTDHVLRRVTAASRLGKYMVEVEQENENRRRVLDAHNIVSVADLSGNIIDANPRFCEITGYERDELIGKNHRIINSGMHPRKFFVEMWETISSGKIWHGEICNRKKNGGLYWVESTIVPLLDEKGRPYQYVSARTDVTHIKKIENDLRISEDRLSRSQSFANIGTWDWNIQDNSLYWSRKIPPLFGFDENELVLNYERFLESIHPDDKKIVIDAVDNCLKGNKEYESEYRCIWPDGTVKWILDRGDVVRNESGDPLHMLGVLMDITDRKNAEVQSRKRQRLLDLLRNGLNKFIENNNISQVADYILEGLLELTESQYGMIGEIHYDDNGDPYVKTHAISNLLWDQQTLDYYNNRYHEGMELRNLDNLIGSAITTGKTVISNDPVNDSRSGVLPEGHPHISSFLAVPVYHGSNRIAIYCMANKVLGYDESIVEFLKPFNVTYSSIVNASRMANLQKQTLMELEASRQEAINANQAKSQFLSNMSHELRTPLNAILGFGQLLEMNLEQNLSLQQVDNVNEIIKAGQHLLSLINEVLDLSKIEAGKVDMHIEPVALLDTVIDCINIVGPLAEQKNINIHIEDDNELDSETNVLADSLRLKQVLINLLSNAIKYNKENGEVTVNVDLRDTNKVRISVIDTGYGIPADQQGKVFESFNRLGAEKRKIEGTGIGLVICKKIVELMSGEIGFHSVPDEGSNFWVEFEVTNEAVSISDIVFENIEMPSAHTGMDNMSKKVIYVEDNLANIRLMNNLFEGLDDAELIAIQDSRIAMSLINEYRPDMVLLDINMPGVDGFQILQKIKQSSDLCHASVIAVSANAMPGEIEKGLRLGFDEYVTKPVVISKFLETIKKRLHGF